MAFFIDHCRRCDVCQIFSMGCLLLDSLVAVVLTSTTAIRRTM